MFYFNSLLQEIFKIAKLRMSDRRPCYSPAGQTVTVVVPHIGKPMVKATGFDPIAIFWQESMNVVVENVEIVWYITMKELPLLCP